MKLGRDKSINDLTVRLNAIGGAVKAAGTWGSFARLLAAHLSKELGRPILYGTTKKFLLTFGLKSAQDLPPIDELKKKQ